MHGKDLLKHGYHGYVKWNTWGRLFLYGFSEVIEGEKFANQSVVDRKPSWKVVLRIHPGVIMKPEDLIK
jgi:hypothetical protein